MKTKRILVTGSSGLIASEAVEFFDRQGHEVVGADNNMRREFVGPAGDALWNLERLKEATKRFTHEAADIRDLAAIDELLKAREIPLLDFEVNVLGTLNLLEATRQHSPEAVFVFMGTNQVSDDASNEIPFQELDTRYDHALPEDATPRSTVDD